MPFWVLTSGLKFDCYVSIRPAGLRFVFPMCDATVSICRAVPSVPSMMEVVVRDAIAVTVAAGSLSDF